MTLKLRDQTGNDKSPDRLNSLGNLVDEGVYEMKTWRFYK